MIYGDSEQPGSGGGAGSTERNTERNPERNTERNTEQQLRRQVEDLQRQLREQLDERRSGTHGGTPENRPVARWRPSGITIFALLLGLAVLLGAGFLAGYIPLQKRDALVRAESAERGNELPHMEVLVVGRSTAESTLQLPGTLQAMTEAPVLARADGYLKKRYVDLGDHVRAGQPLAEIEAPELDQQTRQAAAAVEQAKASIDQSQASVEQAQAGLEQGKANRDLASLTAGRWKTLAAQGVVSQQDNDQYQAQLKAQNANVQALEKTISAQSSNLAASKANLAAAKANLARFQEIENYRTVRAPFDGVITLRNVDEGALVTTGTTLLYRIAQAGPLRTYLNVPQANTSSVHVGQVAQLTLSNFPGRHFTGKIVRTANALDPSSRTMLVEVDVPNNDGALYPGMYAQVDLTSARADPPLLVPASALVTRGDGAQVAVVNRDGVVHLQKVAIGRDFGDRVEIVQGVQEGATILAAPGDSGQEGVKVVPIGASAQP